MDRRPGSLPHAKCLRNTLRTTASLSTSRDRVASNLRRSSTTHGLTIESTRIFTYLEVRSFADGSVLGRDLAVGAIAPRGDWTIPILGPWTSDALRASAARRASGPTRRGFCPGAARPSAAETGLLRDRLLVAVAIAAVRHDALKRTNNEYFRPISFICRRPISFIWQTRFTRWCWFSNRTSSRKRWKAGWYRGE